jgi:hypothetical protein
MPDRFRATALPEELQTQSCFSLHSRILIRLTRNYPFRIHSKSCLGKNVFLGKLATSVGLLPLTADRHQVSLPLGRKITVTFSHPSPNDIVPVLEFHYTAKVESEKIGKSRPRIRKLGRFSSPSELAGGRSQVAFVAALPATTRMIPPVFCFN